jgi:hypothetical protein
VAVRALHRREGGSYTHVLGGGSVFVLVRRGFHTWVALGRLKLDKVGWGLSSTGVRRAEVPLSGAAWWSISACARGTPLPRGRAGRAEGE